MSARPTRSRRRVSRSPGSCSATTRTSSPSDYGGAVTLGQFDGADSLVAGTDVVLALDRWSRLRLDVNLTAHTLAFGTTLRPGTPEPFRFTPPPSADVATWRVFSVGLDCTPATRTGFQFDLDNIVLDSN